MMNKLTDTLTLANGVKLPVVGFGTWQTPDGEAAERAVTAALECGYRHIDTAYIYRNEKSVGKAIRESGIPREDIFVTSKLWNTHRGFERALTGFSESLEALGLEYLDLFLIHWPANARHYNNWQQINYSTWNALESLYKEGKIRAIGVSNFQRKHLKALTDLCEIKPMVDQIEFHPGFTQPDTVAFCREQGVAVEAWGPMGTGVMLENDIIVRLAEKYCRTPAQLCIRFALQSGAVPLPKSTRPDRIRDNAKVFDFEISDEDMAYLHSLPYIGGSGFEPDEVNFGL